MSNANHQMVFLVLLFSERGLQRKDREQVARWFERFPGPVTVQPATRTVELDLSSDGVLSWDHVFERLRRLRRENNVSPDSYVFLITKSPNEMNWYAVQDQENLRNGFGHFSDFSWVTSAPASAIASHYILKGIYNTLLSESGIEWLSVWHQEPRGCFFDFCVEKEQLNLKLRTADICGDCMQVFKSIGIPDSLLAQTVTIMEAARRLALNTGQFLPADLTFDKWPFPVAVTRHKVVQASNPTLRFILLLDHFGCLVRYAFLAKEVLGSNRPHIVDHPSLGWWVDQLSTRIPGAEYIRQIHSIAEQERVVQLRNETIGHGWSSGSEDTYRDGAIRLERVLSRMEEELEPFFASHQLVVPRKIQLRGGSYIIEGERLIGSHLLHPRFELTLDKDPVTYGITSEAEVFISDRQMTSFWPMSPYLKIAICPTCRHSRVLITDGGNQYIDVFAGCRVKL